MKTNNKNRNFKKNKFLSILVILLLPFFVGLKVVEINNTELFSNTFMLVKDILLVSLLITLTVNVIILIKNKQLRLCKRFAISTCMFLLFAIFELTGAIKLVYYNDDFKDWLIKTSVGSINYKSVATSIYSEKTIDEVIDKETKNVDTKDDLVDYSGLTYNRVHYANKFEEDILEHEEGQLYKIVNIKGTTIGANYHYEGYMAIVYDPSRVTLAPGPKTGYPEQGYVHGETPQTFSKMYGAKVTMNAGGFYDPGWTSSGGTPHGPVISNGKLVMNFPRWNNVGGGIIGFNKENKLVLKRMSGEQAIKEGIRDGIDWGPFLIVDGVNKYKNVKYYSFACARAAIGQRADGVVLLLVIDGLQEYSKGASMADVAAIMEKYGAVNAANLDGGTSTMLTENHWYVNKPWNGYVTTYRRIPNVWMVK